MLTSVSSPQLPIINPPLSPTDPIVMELYCIVLQCTKSVLTSFYAKCIILPSMQSLSHLQSISLDYITLHWIAPDTLDCTTCITLDIRCHTLLSLDCTRYIGNVVPNLTTATYYLASDCIALHYIGNVAATPYYWMA